MSELRRNAVFPTLALVSVLVPFAIAMLFGLDALSAVRAGLFVAGLVTAGVVWWKPQWFWDHPEIEATRDLLGNRGSVWLYYLIAAFIVYLSVMAPGR